MQVDIIDKFEEQIGSLKEINVTLEEDCKELKIELKDRNVENLHLIGESEESLRVLQIMRDGEQKLKEQVDISKKDLEDLVDVSNKDLEDLRLQVRNLKLENK